MANENTVLKYIRNIKGKWQILLFAILGIALIIISKSLGGDDKSKATAAEVSAEEYRAELTTEISELCAEMQGVGRVKVMITLDGGTEYVYAKNEGSSSHSYITYSGEGLLLTQNLPKVKGVSILCDGANSIEVRKELTEMLCALLDIGANSVSIGKIK